METPTPSATSARRSVLVVAPSAYTLGGVPTWLDALLPRVAAAGWRVELGLLAGDHHNVDRYLAAHPFPIAQVHPIANRSGSREGRVRALGRVIARLDPDVVMTVNVADIEEAVDRLRRRRRGLRARLVVTQHGLQQDYFDHLRRERFRIDVAVATNRLTTELLVKGGGLEPERARYAPYGVEATGPAINAAGGKGRYPEEPDCLRIVWAGRLEQPQKRVLDLPDICDALTERGVPFRLLIAGSGEEESTLAARLARHLAAGRVELLGAVDRQRLRDDIFTSTDVLLITSSWETGPIVAWEAYAAGLAVVSSRFLGSGLEFALRDRDTALLFPIGSPGDAADALAISANEPAQRRRLAAAGLQVVKSRYTLEASAAAWLEALEHATTFDPRPPAPSTLDLPLAGRLDIALGPRTAEAVREQLAIRHPQAAPGDEWPHAYGGAQDPGFLALARDLDRCPTPGPGQTSAAKPSPQIAT